MPLFAQFTLIALRIVQTAKAFAAQWVAVAFEGQVYLAVTVTGDTSEGILEVIVVTLVAFGCFVAGFAVAEHFICAEIRHG